MFDDQPISSTPPANLPIGEPEDMFADTDQLPTEPAVPNALEAGVLKPKQLNTSPSVPRVATLPFQKGEGEGEVSLGNSPQMYAVKEPIVGKIILILVLLMLFGIGGYFGYRLYKSDFFAATPTVIAPTSPPPSPRAGEGTEIPAPPPQPPVVPEPVVEPQPLPTTTAEAGVNMASDEILFGQGVDSDKDGLDDVREAEIGTNSTQADSDSDGLSDGDEVIIWKTDPLKKDTDGDTFSDGQEVQNGYNPLGPGKLFNVPTTTAR